MSQKLTFGGVVVYTDDVRATLDFYQRAFGLETRFFDETFQYAELATGSAPIAVASHTLGEMLIPGHYQPHTVEAGVEIAFLALDVPAAFARAVEAGATPIAEPKTMPWGATVAYVRSIEGTQVGFSTPMGG